MGRGDDPPLLRAAGEGALVSVAEILFAFIGFLESKDFAGFCGVCTAVFLTYSGLKRGGAGRILHDWQYRFRKFVLEQRLDRLKRKRKFDVIDGGKDDWIH